MIPDKATMIKYKALLNADVPAGAYVDIYWKRTRRGFPREIKYEKRGEDIQAIIDRLAHRWTGKRIKTAT